MHVLRSPKPRPTYFQKFKSKSTKLGNTDFGFLQVETPRPSEDQRTTKTVDALLDSVTLHENNGNAKNTDPKQLKLVTGDAKKASVEDDTTMKTIEI